MKDVMEIQSDPELLAALRKVHVMTPYEQREQLVSFVWGCLDISNPLTQDDVRRMLADRNGSTVSAEPSK